MSSHRAAPLYQLVFKVERHTGFTFCGISISRERVLLNLMNRFSAVDVGFTMESGAHLADWCFVSNRGNSVLVFQKCVLEVCVFGESTGALIKTCGVVVYGQTSQTRLQRGDLSSAALLVLNIVPFSFPFFLAKAFLNFLVRFNEWNRYNNNDDDDNGNNNRPNKNANNNSNYFCCYR